MPEEFIWCLEFAVKEIEQIDVGFSCICYVIDNQFHHNIDNNSLHSSLKLEKLILLANWKTFS